MRLFVEEGVSRLITLNGGPVCAATRGKQGFEPRPGYRDDFGRFARAVLERYGPGGEFFAELGAFGAPGGEAAEELLDLACRIWHQNIKQCADVDRAENERRAERAQRVGEQAVI